MIRFSITHPNGETYDITGVKSAIITQEKNKYASLSIDVQMAGVPPFLYQDIIEVDGERYTLCEMEESERIDDSNYSYKLVFYGPGKVLEQSPFVDMDEDGVTLEPDSPPMVGDLEFWGNVICNNVNWRGINPVTGSRLYESFIRLGTLPADTESKYIAFTEYNAFAALRAIASAYSVSFSILRDTAASPSSTYILNFGSEAALFGTFPTALEYGQGRGLFTLQRRRKSDKNVKTVLTVLGSATNLPSDYPYSRLRLDSASYPNSVISDQAKIAKYGYIHDLYKVDGIMPCRNGSITSIADCSVLQFIDSGIDFNPLGGTVNALSGQLAGYSFEIAGWDEESHKVTIKTYTDANGLVVPSVEPYLLAVSDKYSISGIAMPATYVPAAQVRLATAAQAFYDKVSQPSVSYNLSLHTGYLKSQNTRPVAGMLINIKDAGWGVDKLIPIYKLTRDLMSEDDWSYTSCDITEDDSDTLTAELYKSSRKEQKRIETITGTEQTSIKSLKDAINSAMKAIGYDSVEDAKTELANDKGIIVKQYVDGVSTYALNVDLLLAYIGIFEKLIAKRLVTDADFNGFMLNVETIGEGEEQKTKFLINDPTDSNKAKIEIVGSSDGARLEVANNEVVVRLDKQGVDISKIQTREIDGVEIVEEESVAHLTGSDIKVSNENSGAVVIDYESIDFIAAGATAPSASLTAENVPSTMKQTEWNNLEPEIKSTIPLCFIFGDTSNQLVTAYRYGGSASSDRYERYASYVDSNTDSDWIHSADALYNDITTHSYCTKKRDDKHLILGYDFSTGIILPSDALIKKITLTCMVRGDNATSGYHNRLRAYIMVGGVDYQTFMIENNADVQTRTNSITGNWQYGNIGSLRAKFTCDMGGSNLFNREVQVYYAKITIEF